MPSWYKLNEYISNRPDFLESISDIRKPTLSSQSTSQKTHSFHVMSDTSYKPCKLSKQSHALRICRKFNSMTVAEDTKHITDNNSSINCLLYGHIVGDCMRISDLGGTVLENSYKVCAVTLKSRKSQFFLDTTMIVISEPNHLMPSTVPSISGWDGLCSLDLAGPCFYLPVQIDILIGSDILPSILKSGVQKILFGNFLAQESAFGWFISGPLISRSVTTIRQLP